MIHIHQLSKSYGGKPVLHDISAVLEKGKTYGIVGENGSGKTTLFKCLTGMESFEGSINATGKEFKNHIGYLPTEPYFFSKITGKEYLQLLCVARGTDPGDIKAKNIFDLPLDKYAVHYSTGMKKKLALMAILLQENQYYLLDEPFNGIDIQSSIILTDILKALKQLGKTLLLSSHIFTTLTEICDEIWVLQNGQIVRRETIEGFAALEREMRNRFVGDAIERLGLK
jgi:ABC-2 type transport system ATP-binding protein